MEVYEVFYFDVECDRAGSRVFSTKAEAQKYFYWLVEQDIQERLEEDIFLGPYMIPIKVYEKFEDE